MKANLSSRNLVLAAAALAVFVAACSKDPEVAKREYVRSGDEYLARKQYKEAVIEYRNAVKLDARFGAARQKLADAYFKTGDVENGFRESMRAADLLPDDVGVQLKAGELLLTGNRYEDAIARADKALARDPQNVDAQILKANALAGLHKLDEAVAQVEDAIQRAPDRSTGYSSLGALQMIRGHRDEAEAAFKKAAATDPKSPEGYLALANFYWAAGRPQDAEAQLKNASSAAPQDEAVNRALGFFYMGTGRAAEAEAPLKTYADVAQDGSGKLTLSDYYLTIHRIDDARRALETVPRTDEHSYLIARLRLAGLDVRSGNRKNADALVNEVLTAEPKNVDALLVKAQLLVADGKFDEALAIVRQAIDIEPRSAQAHYALGRLLVARRDTEGAMNAFNEALRLNPSLAEVELELAKLYLEAGRLDQSEQFARSALMKIPNHTEALVLVAHIDLVKGRVDAAERTLTALVTTIPGSPAVQTEFGRLQLAKNNRAEARSSFERALSKDPTFVDALSALTQMDLTDKHLDVARARIDAAVQRSGNDGRTAALAGETYVALGDYAKAEPELRQAIDAEPGNLRAYGLLAQVLASQKRLPQATSEFETLAAKAPKAIGVQTFVALLLQVQNRTEEARTRYEKILEIDPRAAVAANNLAWIYAEQGQKLDIALQLAQTAKAQLPNEPTVSDTLAWVYYKKDLSDLAIPVLEPLSKQDPNNPVYHYHLGLAYARTGDKGRARQSLERALALNLPPNQAADARSALATLK